MADRRTSPRHQNFNADEHLNGTYQEVDHSQPTATSHLAYLTEELGNEPATPPYRRNPSTSQLDLQTSRMPPEYRSTYARSNDKLNREDNTTDDDHERGYPDEKSSRRQDNRTDDDHEGSVQHAKHRKVVHYPDTDGEGPLHNATPKSKRFTDRRTSVERDETRTHSRTSSVMSSDAEDDEEDIYDWSDEGDLVDEEAKFEKKMGRAKKSKSWGLWKLVTFFFSTFIGSALLSGALVAGAVLMRIYWLRPHRTDHREYVMDNVEAWLLWAAANVLISWCLASLIDLLPHVVTLFVNIVWGTVTEAWKSQLELYETAKVWVKPLFYAACSWVSWVILFEGVFGLYDSRNESNSRASYTPRVYQVIRFLFFLTLVVCLEKLLIQMIAFSFHRTAYQERLDAVANAVKVLDHLRDHKPKRKQGGGTYASRSALTGIFSPFVSGASTTSGQHDPHTKYVSRGRFIPRKKKTLEPAALEEGSDAGHDGSMEDEGETKTTRKRSSWINLSGGSSPSTSKPNSRNISRKNSVMPLQESPLHHYPPTMPFQSQDKERADGNLPSGRKTPDDGHHLNRKSEDGLKDSKLLQTAGKALKSAMLHDARNMVTTAQDGESTVAFGLNSAHEAKHIAREIYNAFLGDRKRKYLIRSDFFPAYKTPEEAKEAFKVFDKDGNGDVTRAEIKTAVMKVYKERRSLAKSLRDASAAVATLDIIVLVLFLIVLIFIALPIFGFQFSTKDFSSGIYTLFIGASFIFKGSVGSMFDSIMFLFVTHPFDTGDRCFIDEENLVVKKMGLFATQFIRSDGSHLYYFNSMLLNKFINNARRSGDMAENLEMQVHWRTPQWKLDMLEKRINEWIDSDEKRWFKPGTSVSFSKIEFQRSLYLTIGIGYNGTWQDWSLRLARKTAFHAATQYYCREIGITCYDSSQPIVFVDKVNDRDFMEDNQEATEPITPRSPNGPTSPVVQGPEFRHPMLGFLPPQGKNQLRVRRSNKKKLMGAAEGDAS